jgi:hypothetical protein
MQRGIFMIAVFNRGKREDKYKGTVNGKRNHKKTWNLSADKQVFPRVLDGTSKDFLAKSAGTYEVNLTGSLRHISNGDLDGRLGSFSKMAHQIGRAIIVIAVKESIGRQESGVENMLTHVSSRIERLF